MLCVLLVQPARGRFAYQNLQSQNDRRIRLGKWRVPTRQLRFLQKTHGVDMDALARDHCLPFSEHAALRVSLFAPLAHPGELATDVDRHIREYMFLQRDVGLQKLLWSRIVSMAVLSAPAKLRPEQFARGSFCLT